MTFDHEQPYIDYALDENFLEWYEFEGPIQITELSRQIRTLLNFKWSTIRYFYLTNVKSVKVNYEFEKVYYLSIPYSNMYILGIGQIFVN